MLCNVIMYLISTLSLFCVFFLFDSTTVKSMSDLKKVSFSPKIHFIVALSILSLAGLPPLIGFSGKFSLIVGLTNTANMLSWMYVIIFNLFGLYFYIHIFKYFHSSQYKNSDLIKSNRSFLCVNLVNYCIVFATTILMGTLIFNDVFLIIQSIICA